MEGRFFKDNLSVLGDVGIGTNNPKSILEIAANNPVINFKDTSAGTDLSYRYIQNVDGKMLFAKANDAYNSFTTHMAIATDGNVGIGTHTPIAPLNVVSTGVGIQPSLDVTNNQTAAADVGVEIRFSGITNSSLGKIRSAFEDVGSNSYMSFHTRTSGTPTEKMRIDYSGNVGIGIIPTNQRLEINGNFLLQNGNEIRQKDSGGTQRTIIELDSSNDLNIGGSYAGALKFIGGGSYSEVMRIHDDGNVGIGTTSPDYELEVSTSSNSRIAATSVTNSVVNHLQADSSGAYVGPLSNHSLFIKTNNTTRVTVDTSGNVGIGTATPSRNLEVYRSGAVNFGLTAATSGNAAALFKGRSNVTNIATGPAQGGGNLSLYNLDTSDGNFNGFGFYNSNSLITSGILGVNVSHSSRHGALVFQTHNGSSLLEGMRIDKDGNVGIGTNAPNVKLEIKTTTNSSSHEEALRLYNAGGSVGAGVKIGLGVGATYIEKGHIRTDIISGGAGRLFLGTNGTDRMVIDSVGNVGIGTTDPAEKLHVTETIRAGSAGNSSANLPALRVYASGTNPEQSSIAIQQGTNVGDTIIFADYEPYVEYGINTDNGNDTIEFTAGTSTNNLGSKTLYNNSGSARTAYKKVIISLLSGNMSVGGNVGIGTASPGYKLDVDGNAAADTYGFRSDSTAKWYYFDTFSGSNFIGRGSNAYTSLYDTGTLSMVWKNGNVGIGTTDPSQALNIVKSDASGSAEFDLYSTNSLKQPMLTFRKSASNTIGTKSVTPDGGELGEIEFIGVNTGSNFAVKSVSILGLQDGTAGATYIPGALTFGTGTNAAAVSERMRIDSAGNVGIGTTAPSDKLHVVQNVDLNTALFKNTSGRAQVIIDSQSTTQNSYLTLSNGGSEFAFLDANTSTNLLRIATNNTGAEIAIETNSQDEAVRIDSTGNVGIGTASPLGKLDILRFSSAEPGLIARANKDGAKMNFAYTNSNSMGEIGTTYNNSTGAMRLWIGGNLNSNSTGHVGPTQQGTSSSSWFSEYNTNNDYYQINRIAAGGGTTSSTLFHINSAGYVGIGTTAPSKKLDVNGDVKITGDTFNDGFLQAYGSNFNLGNNSYGVFLGTYSGGTGISPGEVALSTQEKTGWNVGDGLGRIRFFLGDASGVGVRDVAKIEAVSETGNGSTSTTASGALTFYTSPFNSQVSERVRIDKDGKVGIGTTSPAEKLHIGSGASENSNLFVRVDGDAAFQKGFNIFADGSEQWRIYTTASSSDLRFYDGSNVTVTFEDGGNVGIGTTSPDGNLEIWESAVDTAASLRLTGDPDAGANTEYANIIFHSRDSNTGANGGEAQIRAYRGGDRDAPYLNFDLANTGGTLQQVMTIHGQNNAVGIGTTSPDNTLHVRSGNTNTVARFESADATARIIFQDNSGQTSIGATGDDMVFTTLSGLTERMRIKSDGNVGIGTISPSTKLQVAGTSQFDGDLTVANSTLTITAAAPNLLFTVPSGGLDSRIFNDGSGNFIIGHGTNSNTPTERLRIDSAGNVGIGTATPASKLQIISSTSGDSVLKVDGTNGTLFEVVDDLSDSLMSVNDAAGLPVFEVFADNHIVAGRYNQNDFYLDTNGYVGIGTTNPSSRLHLVSNVAVGNIFEIDNQAGNQVLRVSQASTLTALSMSDQNGAFKCGLTASSTLGGGISLSDTSGGTYLTSFASVGTVFNESGSAVDFRIEGDTDANLFFVDGSTDRIGIGTSSPTRTLHIVGAIQIDGTIDANSGAYLTSGGVWTDASSRELKKDIINLSLIKASEAVKLLNPVEFSYKATPEERRVGFIAEDVPDLVASEGRKGLSSMQIVAALTKVVQNQQKEIEWCKEQIEKLTKIK